MKKTLLLITLIVLFSSARSHAYSLASRIMETPGTVDFKIDVIRNGTFFTSRYLVGSLTSFNPAVSETVLFYCRVPVGYKLTVTRQDGTLWPIYGEYLTNVSIEFPKFPTSIRFYYSLVSTSVDTQPISDAFLYRAASLVGCISSLIFAVTWKG